MGSSKIIFNAARESRREADQGGIYKQDSKTAETDRVNANTGKAGSQKEQK